MRTLFFMLPALLLAGVVAAQSAGRTNPADPQAKVPPVEYRSAFEGYRPFAEEDLRDWRKSNDEVGAAGDHTVHRPGQGPGRQTTKPQPPHQGHGAHK